MLVTSASSSRLPFAHLFVRACHGVGTVLRTARGSSKPVLGCVVVLVILVLVVIVLVAALVGVLVVVGRPSPLVFGLEAARATACQRR
jgi:hypothetical protein